MSFFPTMICKKRTKDELEPCYSDTPQSVELLVLLDPKTRALLTKICIVEECPKSHAVGWAIRTLAQKRKIKLSS